MCGIFAINKINLNPEQKLSVHESLSFRGPDYQSGCIEYKGWTLYHSRLSIIGLSDDNNQPIISSDGALIYNGEIFNYRELGEKYFNIKFESDTKLLYKLIINGKLNLNELDGFFSFVFINKVGKLEYAVRDRLGVKPLFVFSDNGSFGFSSEASVFNKLFKLGFCPRALEEYRSLRYPMFNGSYFNKVSSVDPGCCFKHGIYFDLNDLFSNVDNEPSLSELESALIRGVETRMVSDAKIGLLLSKGVDSNLIRNISCIKSIFSIGFEGDDDLDYVNKLNYDKSVTITCCAETYLKTFVKLVKLRGEPLSVPNEVLLYLIAKEARKQGCKVLLSGEGADEFFGGYDRIYSWASVNTSKFDLDQFLNLYCYQIPEKDSHTYGFFKNLFLNMNSHNTFNKVRLFFIKYHMPVLFRRLDFSLMAAGVEGREPIANIWLLNVALKFTSKSLMYNGLGKKPLRDILAKFEGGKFAFEKKIGFPVDIKKIFQNNNDENYEIWYNENLKALGL